AGDSVSAFGGILAVNRPVDAALADAIARPTLFFECIIAPEFAADALATLTERVKWGKSVRLLATGTGTTDSDEPELRKVRGGMLVQTRDDRGADDPFRVVTK